MAQLFPHPSSAKSPADSGNSSGSAEGAAPPADNLGPRKLIRPSLSSKNGSDRAFARRDSLPVLAHHNALSGNNTQESSHAELFYFQKQVQTQTLMVFMLEDGEQIEGYIEWYDRNAIKVKHGSQRTLIYKAGIKYLYKNGENHP